MATAAAAQPPAGNPGGFGNFREEVSVGYVLVPVVVRAPSGYVTDLEAGDFRLLVDGRPVAIESFEQAPAAPVSVTFLQDLSGSMANSGKLELSRQAIGRFLDLGRPADVYSLVSFGNGRVSVDVPPTGEEAELRRAMGGWRAWGTTALHDAVSQLPTVIQDSASTKRAAILITDGADNASRIAPEEARARVRQAELPVYVLGLDAAPPAAVQPAAGVRYVDLLTELASETGGACYWLSDPRQLPRAASAIVKQLRHQYVLGFAPGNAGEARYRPLTVVMTKRHGKKERSYRITFRRGYVGRAPRSGSG